MNHRCSNHKRIFKLIGGCSPDRTSHKEDDHEYNDTIEHRDGTPHSTWTAAGLGDFNSQFISKWEAAHLAKLQSDWDNNNGDTYDLEGNLTHTETESEKITRLGARPTSYSVS